MVHELTYGEKLVGITFNPANDDKISKIKTLCADLADIVNDVFMEKTSPSAQEVQIFNHTIGEILNAQMCAVKLITFKY